MTGDHHQPPLPAPDHDGDRLTPALVAAADLIEGVAQSDGGEA